MIETGKIGSDSKDFQIYIQVEQGSIKEIFKILFRNKTTIAIIGTFVIPFLNTTYDHFLNRSPEVKGEFAQEIQTIEGDQKFKKNLKAILSPLNNNDDNMIINNGTINIDIDYDKKESICKNIDTGVIDEEEYKKNGEFEEELTGLIRMLNLDAPRNNYFGFNIDKGPSQISTSIRGEFNLLDYLEIIDENIKVKAVVKYKDDEIKHIEIISYEILDKTGKQEKINL